MCSIRSTYSSIDSSIIRSSVRRHVGPSQHPHLHPQRPNRSSAPFSPPPPPALSRPRLSCSPEPSVLPQSPGFFALPPTLPPFGPASCPATPLPPLPQPAAGTTLPFLLQQSGSAATCPEEVAAHLHPQQHWLPPPWVLPRAAAATSSHHHFAALFDAPSPPRRSLGPPPPLSTCIARPLRSPHCIHLLDASCQATLSSPCPSTKNHPLH